MEVHKSMPFEATLACLQSALCYLNNKLPFSQTSDTSWLNWRGGNRKTGNELASLSWFLSQDDQFPTYLHKGSSYRPNTEQTQRPPSFRRNLPILRTSAKLVKVWMGGYCVCVCGGGDYHVHSFCCFEQKSTTYSQPFSLRGSLCLYFPLQHFSPSYLVVVQTQPRSPILVS